jgi:predicted ribosome quality control (RQC) complex YloA/Tae2 family protein
MKITLDLNKSLEENASYYFELAKTAKKKADGAREALEHTKKKLVTLEKDLEKKAAEEALKAKAKERKKEWYEKFRWFITTEGLLVIGGRDATTNEIVIKKHTDPEDLVFHTEMAGSPFVVIKGKPSDISIEEAAVFTACYSKAWKAGRTASEVFYVNPDQVTKEAPAGEYIVKGAFMIYGKKNILSVPLKLFIGKMEDGKIMAGPESAVKRHCEKSVEVVQGNDKISQIAKKIMAKIGANDLDDIVKIIPQGSRLA